MNGFRDLTPRETDVIACVISGKTSKSIARILNISPRTVETHLYNLMLKLDVVSRQGLIEHVENSPHYADFKKHYCDLIKVGESQTQNISGSEEGSKGQKLTFIWTHPRKTIMLTLAFSVILIFSSMAFFLMKSDSFQPNQNNGHMSLAQAWNLPNLIEHYTPRNKILNSLWKEFFSPESNKKPLIIVGLYGLGGVGKSTLATHMVHHPKRKYDFRGWFNAETPDLLTQAYFEIGEKEKLFPENLPNETKIKIVKEWLGNKKNSLLVYDNAPDMGILQEYLPNKGHILITSRNNKIPVATGIESMSSSEAFELLDRFMPPFAKGRKNYKQNALSLIRKLGEFPLALAQSGSYIKEHMLTVEEYLKLYESSRKKLLHEKPLPPGDQHEAVYNTWAMTLAAIKTLEYGAEVIDLLNFISMCYWEEIPKKLLIQYLYGETTGDAEILFNRLLTLLLKHSLVKVTANHISIHKLLHNWVALNQTREEKRRILERGIKAMQAVYPPYLFKTIDEIDLVARLLPHIESLIKNGKSVLKDYESVDILSILGNVYNTRYYYQKSKETLERNLQILDRHFGREHIKIADELSFYARSYFYSGEYQKAKKLSEKSLLIQEKHYGENHIKTITSISNLAQAHLFLGDYEKASQLMNKQLKIIRNHFGKIHLATGAVLKEVGFHHLYLERYATAQETLKKALNIFQKLNAMDHHEARITLLNLGWANLYLGHYEKSLHFSQKALDMHQQKFPTNYYLLTFLTHSTGLAHLFSGDIEKGEEILEHNVKLRQKIYGKDHIRTAYVLNSMGILCAYKKEYEKARQYFEKAHSIVTKKFGPAHRLTFRAQINLGAIDRKLGRLNESRKQLEESLHAFQSQYGEDDLNMAVIMANLGLLHGEGRDKEQKRAMLEKALSIFKKQLSPDHIYMRRATEELYPSLLNFFGLFKKDVGFYIVY